MLDQIASVSINRSRSKRTYDCRNESKTTVEVNLTHINRELGPHLIHKGESFVIFSDECLNHCDSRDFLCQSSKHFIVKPTLLVTRIADLLQEEEVAHDIEGSQHQNDQCQAPFQEEQHREHRNECHDIADEGYELALDQALDQLNIRRNSGHDLAGLSLVVKRKTQPLKVPPSREAQVKHKSVPNPGHGVRVGVTEKIA